MECLRIGTAGWVSKHRGLAGAIIITIAGAIVSGTWVQPGDLHDHQAHQTISPSAATWEITATATAPQLQIEAGKTELLSSILPVSDRSALALTILARLTKTSDGAGYRLPKWLGVYHVVNFPIDDGAITPKQASKRLAILLHLGIFAFIG